jgi:hypothetical protein
MLKKVYSDNGYIYLNKYQNEKSILNELDL